MNNSSRFDLSVVGELNLDLVLYGLPAELELDREHLATDMRITLGSSSAIFAHNFALLGNDVGFNSAIGEDQLGELCLERLRESGVHVEGVRRVCGKQTGLTVILPRPQKRYILTYPGVMAEMQFEDLELDRVFHARHFHLSSFFLQRTLRPRIKDLFRLAKAAGLTTSLDTNDDPEGQWASDVAEVLPHVDVLLPNETEACQLARTQDPLKALAALAQKIPCVVMKCGEKGAVASQSGKVFTSAAQKTDAVDSIGAGDSFDAGFLHKFIRGKAIEECLRYGNLVGALSTTRQGGTEAFRDAAHRKSFLKE